MLGEIAFSCVHGLIMKRGEFNLIEIFTYYSNITIIYLNYEQLIDTA